MPTTTKKSTAKKTAAKKDEFKLPKYLRLEKGSMWFDTEGENCSGVKLYAFKQVLVGRPFESTMVLNDEGKEVMEPVATDIEKDDNNNDDLLNFGKKNAELPWYIDTTGIPKEKLSRVLLAYKHGILVEADPKNPPDQEKPKDTREFKITKQGDRVFVGKNKEMYTKLQNYPFDALRKFVKDAPVTASARQNLIDLLDYEKKGYNALARPRLEVLDLIRTKLNEYGPGISGIRKNEEDEE